jgi:hypothetical protein
MNKLFANLKHLPSTIPGAILTGAGFTLAVTQNPFVAQLAGLDPRIAKYVTAVAGIASGLTLMFGVGPKADTSAKS